MRAVMGDTSVNYSRVRDWVAGAGRVSRPLRLMLRQRRRAIRQQVAYRRWLEVQESRGNCIQEATPGGEQPYFSMLLACGERSSRRTVRAVTAAWRQRHAHWELWIAGTGESLARLQAALPASMRHDDRVNLVEVAIGVDTASAANAALARSTGEFVIRLDPDGELATDALSCFAAAVDRRPDAAILFADHDQIDWSGRRCRPSFKAEFNHVLLLTGDDLSHAVVCRRHLASAIGGWRPGFAGATGLDFVLRACCRVERRRVIHVPCVLHHRRVTASIDAATVAGGQRAVSEHLVRLGVTGSVEPAPEAPSRHRVRLALPSRPPLVTIVICTRDNSGLLARCLERLRARTRYPVYEIILMDNGSSEVATKNLLTAWSRNPGVLVVHDNSPFNFSRLNNTAVAAARGEFICFLNDDTEILTPEWLDEMVGLALFKDVGAVGARLWYPDETLQHAGVVLDPTLVATHAFARYPRGDSGHADRAVVQQEVSAVTAACLVVRRSVFLGLGGFEERLAVAFNDVDLCLRLREAGLHTVWTPYAELIHHESVSRGRDDDPVNRERFEREKAFMVERWAAILACDPYYGPHFSSRWADYSITTEGRGS